MFKKLTIVLLFSLLISSCKDTKTSSAPPAWAEKIVQSEIDLLQHRFILSSSVRTPQYGERFPDIPGIQLLGKTNVIIFGSKSCSSCESAIARVSDFARKNGVNISRVYTIGSLPENETPGVKTIDARIDDSGSKQDVPSEAGKAEQWIGLYTPLAAYIVDSQKIVRYASTVGGFDAPNQLPLVLEDLVTKNRVHPPKYLQPEPRKIIALPNTPAGKSLSQAISGDNITILILSDSQCSACQTLPDILPKYAEMWHDRGYNVLVVGNSIINSKNVALFRDDITKRSELWQSLGSVSLPSAILIKDKKYLGRVPYSSISLVSNGRKFNSDEVFYKAIEQAAKTVETWD